MKRYTIKAGGYGALITHEDFEGEWVRHIDVVKMLNDLKAGKRSAIYRCHDCLGLFDDDEEPAEHPEDCPTVLYCPECAGENRSAAEESTPAYFDRYIAGDR